MQSFKEIPIEWNVVGAACTNLLITRIIQSLYYAPAGRSSSDSADRGRSIIRVNFLIEFKRVSNSFKSDRINLP